MTSHATPAFPSSLPSSPRTRAFLAGAIVLLAFLAYGPALRGEFLWDDELDILKNTALRDAAGLWRIWFHPVGLYDYYPIKYTVQWLQWHLFGLNPLGYHVTNVALHALGALLFWRLLTRLGLRHGWLGAVLFVVHPLAVESVAWITELKNTLSLPFLLLAFLRYLDFDASRRPRDLASSATFFLCAALCKTSVVMFPVTLLLFLWWRHNRLTRPALLSTLPFFLISLALGLVTIWFQQHRAIGAVEVAVLHPLETPLARLACAGSALAFYAWKSLAPLGLMPIYPQWRVDPPSPLLFLPWLALAAVVAVFWIRRAAWGRAALFALGWFVLHLLPVLGFVPISSQRFTWVMDHLAYLSLLAPLAVAVLLFDRFSQARVTLPIALVAAAVLGFLTRQHAAIFRDETALWTYNVARNPAAWMAHYNLGNFAAQAGRSTAAIAHYRAALAAWPAYPEAWNNLGLELRKSGDNLSAIEAFANAIRHKPDHYAAHNNLATALAATGRLPEAIARCERSLQLNPRFAPAHRNLGNLLAQSNRAPEAIAALQRALDLQPDFAEAANDLGVLLARSGQLEPALAAFQRALAVAPDYPEALNNLGSTLRDARRPADALAPLRRALARRPAYPSARYNLALAHLDLAQTDAAIAELQTLLQHTPTHAHGHFTLGNLRAAAGDNPAALEHYDHATRLLPSFAAAHRNAGLILARLDRLPEALARFRAAVAAQPDFVDAHLSLAQAHQALGQIPEAVAAYETARKLKPDLPPLAR